MRLVLLLLLPCLIVATQSSVHISASQNPFKEVVGILLAFGEGYSIGYGLGNYSIPLSSGILKGTLNLTDVTLQGVTADLGSSGISFVAPNDIELVLNDVKAVINFNFVLKESFITYRGTGVLTISKTLFAFYTSILATSKGKPEFFENFLNTTIGSLTLTSTLPNTINSALESSLISEIPTIENEVKWTIGNKTIEINELLSFVNYQYPIQALNSVIDFHLSQNTLVSNGYLCFAITGELLNATNSQPFIPFTPGQLPNTASDNLDFQGFLADNLVNSLVVAYWDQFNAKVTSLPASFPLKLTTDGLAFLIPNLKTTYGKGKNVALTFSSSPAYRFPQIWTNNSLNINVTLNTHFSVEVVPGQWQSALDLLTSIYVNADAGLVNTDVSLVINTINVWQVQVINSNVGTVNTYVLNLLLGNLMQLLTPIINVELGNFNITLPKIPYVDITADLVQINTGYIEVAASLAPNFI